MIDVWGVLANGLWVLGLAIALAVLSWTHWAATSEKIRFWIVLRRPRIQQALDVGLVLFCSGLATTSRAWWEKVLWGLLAVAWAAQAYLVERRLAE